MRVTALAACALLPLAGGARAQGADRPPIRPTRDVDVVYVMTQAGHAMQQRMRWLASAQRMRVDPPTTAGFYMILDTATHRMEVVHAADRSVLEAESPTPFQPLPDATFTRMDTATVAGTPCTEWRTTDAGGEPVIVCFTADGVLLRARTTDHTLLVASAVDYAPQNPADFAAPDGYRHVQAPPPPAAPPSASPPPAGKTP